MTGAASFPDFAQNFFGRSISIDFLPFEPQTSDTGKGRVIQGRRFGELEMEFDEKFGEWKEGATDQDDYRHWNDAEDLERLNWNQNSDCAIPG